MKIYEQWNHRLPKAFKAGDRSVMNNFCLISIVSNFSKVFETVLFNRIYPLVRSLTVPIQYDFMSNRSTETNNLFVIMQHLSETHKGQWM